VLTSAVGVACTDAFVAAGFEVRERLHLLATELLQEPEPPSLATERGTRRDRAPVLVVDDASFDGFWRLGSAGLRDAIDATPVSRFRVGRRSRLVVAYAITGAAADQGYLQRIAVDPTARREGWGHALVADGLGWLWRHGCTRAFVNTQLHNDAAIALYESFGFRRLPEGLCVLGRHL
jgi:ribosomal protein S18 acetylase RimI-like enzyme